MIDKTEQEIMQNWKSDINLPIVSICSTAYNLESCISEALDSFLMQETDFPFEILIRDDCSTDNTVKIIKEYVSQYPKIIKPIYEKSNTYSEGMKPMLQVIKVAKSNYIATCDADDYWTHPLKLQKQVEFLQKSPSYSGCFHDCMIIYEGKEGNKKQHLRIGNRKIVEDVNLTSIIDENNIDSSSIMFKNCLDEIPKFWTENTKDDYALMITIATQGKIKYLPEVMSTYRIHDNSFWSSQNQMYKEKENIKFYTLLEEYFSNNKHVLPAIIRKKRYIYYSISRKLVLNKQRLKSLYYILRSMDLVHSSHPKIKYFIYFKEFVKSIIK